MLFQKTVCVQHTQTYKLTHAHTHSLKRNEDKGLWRPWLAVLFVKVGLTCTCTLTNVQKHGYSVREEMEG